MGKAREAVKTTVALVIGALAMLGYTVAVHPAENPAEGPESNSADVFVVNEYDGYVMVNLTLEYETVRDWNLSHGDAISQDFVHIPLGGYVVGAFYHTAQWTRMYQVDDGFLDNNETLTLTILADGSMMHTWGGP